MVLSRRRFALAVVGVVAGTAGCLDGGLGGRGETAADGSTDTNVDTDAGTDTNADTDTDPGNLSWWAEAERTVDRDKAVELSNRDETDYTVEIRVLRESSGEVVHEGTYELSPGTRRREVFNTKSLDGPGNVGYEVRATTNEQSAHVSFETDECHGGGYVAVEDGDLLAYSGIC